MCSYHRVDMGVKSQGFIRLLQCCGEVKTAADLVWAAMAKACLKVAGGQATLDEMQCFREPTPAKPAVHDLGYFQSSMAYLMQ